VGWAGGGSLSPGQQKGAKVIVTCESCKSRYKIDDSKISGRGARITCPRCKHQFVVYTADKDGKPALLQSGQASWDDEPTRVGAEKAPPSSGFSASSQPATQPASHPASQSSMNAGASGLSGMSGGLSSGLSTHEPARSEAAGPSYEVSGPQSPRLSASEAASRASSLDFRKVGISAWKVKVKIGLIYDFSDLKTLRRYIQDGRVTPSDLISHDGKNWKVIGDIPDLDIFFVETYDQLFHELSKRPPEEVARGEGINSRYGLSDHPAFDEGRSLSSQAQDLFSSASDALGDDGEPRPARSSKNLKATVPIKNKAAPKETSNNLWIFGIIGVLVIAALAWWFYPTKPPPPAPTPAPAATVKPTGSPDVNQAIRNQLAEQGKGISIATPTPEPEQELIPVRPSDANIAAGTPKIDSSARELEAAGDAAARSGRWSEAAKSYQEAVKKSPKDASLLLKLGEAQYKANNTAAAEATLKKAVSMGAGAAAYQLLGDIAKANGDDAGAQDWYEKAKNR
jgi:predicted Zn finger-like uncharacterized protein